MAKVIKTDHSGRSVLHTWTLTSNDPVGESLSYPGTSNHIVQVFGKFNGSSISFEGSLDDKHFFTLTDKQGNGVSFTDDGGESISDIVLYYRPKLSVVGVDTKVSVLLFARSTSR